MLNHKRDFNAEYDISRKEYKLQGTFPKDKISFTKEYIITLLTELKEDNNYTKHYFPSHNEMKVFLKGGSSLVVNTYTGNAIYESVRRRPIISALNRLHYNPNRNWTIFSDIFIISLMIITVTGLVMVKGPKGLLGRGGIELIIGIIIPLCFILL